VVLGDLKVAATFSRFEGEKEENARSRGRSGCATKTEKRQLESGVNLE